MYANISFLKANTGISSDENGTFNLSIDKKLLNEKVHISCLNYKDTIVFAKELQKKILFLEPKKIELDEIVISKKVDREIVVSKIKKRKVNLIGTFKNPWTVARFFDFNREYEETPYLKKIFIFLSKYDRRKAKIRIRIFSKDSITGLPKDDLVKENLIVDVTKKQRKIDFDMSRYDIEIPKTGFFIALERLHIPYNFYEDIFKYKDKPDEKVTRVAPDFGGVLVANEYSYTYIKGKWKSFKHNISSFKGKTLVPAISLTLSN